MKLSSKSTYGLRALLNIAVNGDEEATSIFDIAQKEGISKTYLEQLLNRLRRHGLVKSVRGPKGGYTLSRKASDITVADIVSVLEGGIWPVHCVSKNNSPGGLCKRSGSCVPKLVWKKLADAIKDCLESITLEDLCSRSRKINGLSSRRRSS